MVFLAAVTAACRRGGGALPWSDPVAGANERVGARIASLALPASEVALTRAGGRVRMVVARDGIGVDDAALLASWPASERVLPAEGAADAGAASAAEPEVHERVVALRAGRVPAELRGGEGGWVVAPLRVALERFAALEREHAARTGGARPGEIEVYAERGVSARTLFEAMYTAGQAEYARMYLMMRAPGGGVTAYAFGQPHAEAVRRSHDRSQAAMRGALAALAGAPALAGALAGAPADGGVATLRGGRGDGGAVIEAAADAGGLRHLDVGSVPPIVTVRVTARGDEVLVDDARLREDCTDEVARDATAGPWLPAAGGARPHAALAECLRALRERSVFREVLRGVRDVVVSVDGEMTCGDFADALLAARDSFPDGVAAVGR